nr:MAG TPA: hypothetical protein [Caudoviricetes sp.]
MRVKYNKMNKDPFILGVKTLLFYLYIVIYK